MYEHGQKRCLTVFCLVGSCLAVLRLLVLFTLLVFTSACAGLQAPDATMLPGVELSAVAPPHAASAVLSKSNDFSPADFTLTVLHTNDVHSAFGGTSAKGLSCYTALCEGGRGGYVRLDQAVRAIRQDNPDALFLDAGDIFQGTLFWVQHKERMPLTLLDKMGYQALTPGNHEFDAGVQTWLRLVDGLKTPILAANIAFDTSITSPAVNKVAPYTVLERGGRKIGVVGLITESTPELSSPGSGISFTGAQKALTAAVKELNARDVHIVIALAHLGLENERQLAKAVDGVDIIVGAHSHSFLSNIHPGAEGAYPVVERAPNGSPVLLVTAASACQYLGWLDVGFDSTGVAQTWRGEPVLLDQPSLEALAAPKPNPELVALIEGFAAPLAELMRTSIGQIIRADMADVPAASNRSDAANATSISNVAEIVDKSLKTGMPLEHKSVKECRNAECLTGNIVTDALRDTAFKDAQIAIINSGALRTSLPAGAVTLANVIDTLPFQNTALVASVPGAVILQALEHGIATYGAGSGGFLQVSGLRYVFNPARSTGKRITRVEVVDQNGKWKPLEPKANYRVVTVDFIARGGDGFSMLMPLKWQEGDKLASDALRIYLEEHSPLTIARQGRIVKQQ